MIFIFFINFFDIQTILFGMNLDAFHYLAQSFHSMFVFQSFLENFFWFFFSASNFLEMLL